MSILAEHRLDRQLHTLATETCTAGAQRSRRVLGTQPEVCPQDQPPRDLAIAISSIVVEKNIAWMSGRGPSSRRLWHGSPRRGRANTDLVPRCGTISAIVGRPGR